jgi:hypothetical protein
MASSWTIRRGRWNGAIGKRPATWWARSCTCLRRAGIRWPAFELRGMLPDYGRRVLGFLGNSQQMGRPRLDDGANSFENWMRDAGFLQIDQKGIGFASDASC